MIRRKSSKAPVVIVGASILFAVSALSYVWWMKGADWKLSYRGVLRDVARQRQKLRIDDINKNEESNNQ